MVRIKYKGVDLDVQGNEDEGVIIVMCIDSDVNIVDILSETHLDEIHKKCMEDSNEVIGRTQFERKYSI
jgi:hypothetical protein